MDNVYIRVSRTDYERIKKLIDKDNEHRAYMRRKMAERSGRDPEKCSKRHKDIEITVLEQKEIIEVIE